MICFVLQSGYTTKNIPQKLETDVLLHAHTGISDNDMYTYSSMLFICVSTLCTWFSATTKYAQMFLLFSCALRDRDMAETVRSVTFIRSNKYRYLLLSTRRSQREPLVVECTPNFA